MDATGCFECSTISQVCAHNCLAFYTCAVFASLGSIGRSARPSVSHKLLARALFIWIVYFDSLLPCSTVRSPSITNGAKHDTSKTHQTQHNLLEHANISYSFDRFLSMHSFFLSVNSIPSDRCFGSYFPWPIMYIRSERDIANIIETMIPHPMDEQEKRRLRQLIGWKAT